MAIFDRAKDASVKARRRDEEYNARAMYEIQSGKRRDGLWAKALASTNGDKAAAKLTYFKLLVQALQDDDHVAFRALQAQSNIAQEASIQQSNERASQVRRPSFLKAMWFWFLVAIASLILLFGFLPLIFDGRAGTLSIFHWLIAGFWIVVINYALKKLFPRTKT